MSANCDWSPYNQLVQKDDMKNGQFMSSAYTVISAGPASLSLMHKLDIVPTYAIGLIQSYSMSQQAAVQRIFEIGSERSLVLRGRTSGSFSIGRAMFHGPSLLRAIYALAQDTLPPVRIKSLLASAEVAVPLPKNVELAPGYNDLFLNLASDLFQQPIGLSIRFADNNKDPVGEVYLENAMVGSHSLSSDANSTMLMENVNLTFERVSPVNAAAAVSEGLFS